MPVQIPNDAKRMFEGLAVSVWQWPQKMFDGKTATFECVKRSDSVSVLPFLDKKTVLLTKQEQPGGRRFMDVPGGRVDPGESPEEAVRRELREETGYEARVWKKWHALERNGMIRYTEFLYLAQGLNLASAATPDTGEKIELIKVPWRDLIQMCLKGELRQAAVMLAILSMEFEPEKKAELIAWQNEPS